MKCWAGRSTAGIKTAGRNINNIRNADDTTVVAESEEEPKSLLKVKQESEKSLLQTQHSKKEDLGIRSHHFLANRWGNNGNTDRLYFLGLQNHMDGDCSHEIKGRLLLGRKAMTNRDSIFKSRDITLETNICIVKAMVFPVVMYICES